MISVPSNVTRAVRVSRRSGPHSSSALAKPALRRSAGFAKAELECGPLRLDTRTARVTFDGALIKVTGLEFRLLSYLMHHQSRVISRSELVEHLYQQDFDRDSNTIEVFIGRLRRKIPADVIHTVRGLGYCVSFSPGSDEGGKKDP